MPDAVKEAELGVATSGAARARRCLGGNGRRHGAGIRRRLSADVGIAVTGIAGPAGGTPEKPVGLVYVHVESPVASRGIDFSYPADRESIRRRAAVAALHLTRRLLSQNRHEAM
jgi:nicotinamide-nucleotide amidase